MGRKKLSLFLAISVCLIASPTHGAETPINKGPGEWDKVGYTESLWLHTNDFEATQQVSSYGGNFQIRVTGVSTTSNMYRIWLYEVDGTSKADWTLVQSSPKYGYGDVIHTWDVSSYVDGTNKRAELVAHIGYATKEEGVYISFYD